MGLRTAFKSTLQNKRFWENRDIDWDKQYLQTWNHPHRAFIIQELARTNWRSVLEVGCASGPNLLKIAQTFPNRDFGGVDVNEKAIELARSVFKGAFLEVCPGNDIIMSDGATDIVLTDLMLMYIGPLKIREYLRELKRICRWKIILVELYHPSIWKRLTLMLRGYYAHDYKKLLEEVGCHQIEIRKLPNVWNGEPQNTYAHLITAKTN